MNHLEVAKTTLKRVAGARYTISKMVISMQISGITSKKWLLIVHHWYGLNSAYVSMTYSTSSRNNCGTSILIKMMEFGMASTFLQTIQLPMVRSMKYTMTRSQTPIIKFRS